MNELKLTILNWLQEKEIAHTVPKPNPAYAEAVSHRITILNFKASQEQCASLVITESHILLDYNERRSGRMANHHFQYEDPKLFDQLFVTLTTLQEGPAFQPPPNFVPKHLCPWQKA